MLHVVGIKMMPISIEGDKIHQIYQCPAEALLDSRFLATGTKTLAYGSL